ncbi:unnamed protein product [Paramecium octaurelia]|uniref:K Homology domain-containing protein n=1 Tax=Paramecium octaurelia TaxID=43137 RepID=A0A8S1SQY4_PAROT|nr:unnamed protein product [Paramecium octaurelia]
MDYEGATKKNKPNVQVVYFRVIELNRYLKKKGKLSCINLQSKKTNGYFNIQTTGENLYREQAGGVIVDLPLNFLQSLLSFQAKPELFKEISKYSSFEVFLGKNGRIWIKGHDAVLINFIKKMCTLIIRLTINLINKFSSQFQL